MARRGASEQQSKPEGNVPPVRSDGLQLEENRPFQERWWTIERFAWTGFALVFVLTALGALGGGGVLSDAEQRFEAGALAYPRIARSLGIDDMEVAFEAGAAEHTLTLGDAFAEYFSIQSIRPEPSRTVVTESGHRMHFDFEAGAAGKVVLNLRPSRAGVADFQVAVDGGPPASLTTLILP